MSEVSTCILTNEELKRFYRPVVSEDGNLFEIIAPGYPIIHENAKGDIPFSALADLLSYGRMRALFHPDFGISGILGGQYQLFITYMEYEVSLEFYQDRKYLPIYYPMKFSTRVLSVGKSSINLVTVMRHAVTNTPVAYSYVTLVRVDLLERRSVPIPDHIRGRLLQLTEKPNMQKDTVSILDTPMGALMYTVEARFSDTDSNGHINYASYYNYCMDAVRYAISVGKLNRFLSSADSLLVKRLKSNFAKESKAGDTLNVVLQQDEKLPLLIHCRINKINGDMAFICNIEFYEKECKATSLKLPIGEDKTDLLSSTLANSSFVLSDSDAIRWRHFAFSRCGTRAELVQPAPLLLNSNPRRNLSIDAPILYMSGMNKTVLYNAEYFTSKLLPDGCGSFVVQLHCVYESLIYTEFRRHGLMFPMRSVTEVDSFTNSSVYYIHKLYETENGACLATMYLKLVAVDLKNRKSISIPEYQRERYGKFCVNSNGLQAVLDLQPPSDCFIHSSIVRHSDIDINQHMNQIIYIRLCLDATVAASEKQRLGQFHGDGYSRDTKSLRSGYVKECLVGEAVYIKVWQDCDCVDKLNFRVTKGDGSLSMLCSIEFFPLKKDSRL